MICFLKENIRIEAIGLTCTFFGNRNAPEDVLIPLKNIIIDLITTKHVSFFYVGTHGKFDRMAYSILKELQTLYPFQYLIVYAYLPTKEEAFPHNNTIYPEGIEKVPRRYAIIWRNQWMLERSDYVITYTRNITGGAQMMKDAAIKKNKIVVEIK